MNFLKLCSLILSFLGRVQVSKREKAVYLAVCMIVLEGSGPTDSFHFELCDLIDRSIFRYLEASIQTGMQGHFLGTQAYWPSAFTPHRHSPANVMDTRPWHHHQIEPLKSRVRIQKYSCFICPFTTDQKDKLKLHRKEHKGDYFRLEARRHL